MESDLPFEVLCEILSRLDVRHRLTASLVCRRWFLACNTQLEDVRLYVHGGVFPPTPLTRSFCNVVLSTTDVDPRCVDFLNRLGTQLLYLAFNSCTVSCCPGEIVCPQLHTLETDEADVLTALAPPLSHLQSLLLYNVDASDAMLGLIDAIAPKLKAFELPKCIVFDRRVIRRYYPLSTADLVPLILSTGVVEAFIRKRAATLTSLRLPPSISTDAALRVASTPGLTLTEVDLRGCVHLVAGLGEFFKLQSNVEVLNLCGVFNLGYADVETIVGLLPGLRVFSSSNCSNLERAVVLLFRLRHLRRLRLSCRTFPDDAFSTFASVDLRVLDLGEARVDDEQVRELLTRAPALRELKMGPFNQTFLRDGLDVRPRVAQDVLVT